MCGFFHQIRQLNINLRELIFEIKMLRINLKNRHEKELDDIIQAIKKIY